jgi:hypothetical protein
MNEDTEVLGGGRRAPAPLAPHKPVCCHRSQDEIASEQESKRLQQLAVEEISVLLRAEYVPAWRLLLPLRSTALTRPGDINTAEDIFQHLARELVERHLVQDGRWRASATLLQLRALYVAMHQRFSPEQTQMMAVPR